MCGEYQMLGLAFQVVEGSPPHVWRIQIIIDCFAYFVRITSTCVENTRGELATVDADGDHLHMCGEYRR